MKVMGKALRTFSLFLLLGACVGTISNNKNNNVETIDIKPMVARKANEALNEKPGIWLYGDYDRSYCPEGYYKQLEEGKFSRWRDAHHIMQRHVYPNATENNYFETIIQLKAGDNLNPFINIEGSSNEDGNCYLRYHSSLGDEFFKASDDGQNIVAKQDGVFKLKYFEKGLTDTENRSAYWAKAEEVFIGHKYLIWNYTNPLAADDAARIHVFKGDHTFTDFSRDQALNKTKDGSYIVDVALPFANGYNQVIFHGKTSAQTKTFDLGFMDSVADNQCFKITIDNEANFEYSMNYLQEEINDNFKLTNKTARIWVDDVLKHNQGVFNVLHTWDNKDHIETYLPTKFTNISTDRYVACYDIPVSRFTSNWKYMFKVYSNDTYKYQSNYGAYSLDKLSTNKMTYLSSSNNNNQTTQGIAIDAGNTIKAEQLVPILEAYYTCSSSKLNGYGDFATFKETWLGNYDETKHAWSKVSGDINSTTFNDFNKKDTASYETGDNKTNSISVADKIKGLNEQFVASNPTSNFLGFDFNTSLTTSIIIVSSILAVAVLGFVTFIISKKVRLHR